MDYKKRFITYIEKEKRYSKHTVIAYEKDIDQFLAFLSRKLVVLSVGEVTNKVVREWVVILMSNGTAASTVNRKLSTLKSFYKFLAREKLVSSNPVEGVTAPKTGKKLPVFLSEENMERLEFAGGFEDSFEGYRDRLILEMIYQTGIRRSELIGLKISDIDLKRRELKVLGKGNKERIIPFETGLRRLIEDYICVRNSELISDSEYLFVTAKGAQVYDKLVYRVVKKYLSTVTTQSKRSPHVLRHTFATHLLNNGAELEAIKELLGHANLSATQVYTHNSFEKLKKVFKQAHPRA